MKRFVDLEHSLRTQGFKLTPQRRVIVREALREPHFSAEELVGRVRAVRPLVARGTVYRTLVVLDRLGVLERHDFRAGAPRYELVNGRPHHDHHVCVDCGTVVEFTESRIEALQDHIVKRYGFRLVSHSHKLYGLCRTCQAKPNGQQR